MDVSEIARTCHEVNRIYCQSLGDYSQPNWNAAPEWQQLSAMQGVEFHLDNPDAGDEASHENWCREKFDDGWEYGEKKDPLKKLHPCLVPFDELPPEQQKKDRIFRSLVHLLKD
jgi:hypothetical protein